MKKSVVAIWTLGLGLGSQCAVAAPAQEHGFYLGGSYNMVSIKVDDSDTIKPKAITLAGGWNFNRYAAVEARIGFGAGSDESTYSDSDATFNYVASSELKVDSYVSALFRGTLPVGENVGIYGLLGYTSGKLKATYNAKQTRRSNGAVVYSETGEDSESDSSVAYGLGAEFKFAGHSGVSLEWGRFLSGDGYDADAVSLGYRYRF